MKKSLAHAVAVAAITAVFSLCCAIPASAAVTASEWGDWDAMFLSVSYDNSAFVDGTFSVTGEDDWDNLSPADQGEGFSADTPLGALFGSNVDATAFQFLKVTTLDNNDATAIVEITFETEVPANQLVLALSDVDSDRATITMYDGESNAVSAANIIGTAATTGFNWDDVTNTSDVPTTTTIDPNTVVIGDAPDDTDGSTGWVRPSAGVKFIHVEINTEDGNYSSQRIWLGQLLEATPAAELGHTGVDKSNYLLAIAGGAILAAGGFIGLRRRRDI